MTISTQRLRLLRGNSTAAGAFTGLQGELVFDTTLYTLRLQDGITPGGYTLATSSDLANVSANINYGNSNVGAYLTSYTGNLSAGNIFSNNYLYANGVSILTGIQSNYGNANVASYLPTYTGNLTAGNIFSNNYLYANGVNILTGIQSNYGNSNVASYLTTYSGNLSAANIVSGNILPSANVTYSLGSSTAQWKDLWLSNNTLYLGGIPITVVGDQLTVNGNVINSNSAQLSRSGYTVSLEDDGDVVFPGNIVSGEGGLANFIDLHTASLGDMSINGVAAMQINTDFYGTAKTWNFDSFGNLTLPSNISAINYANGVSILNGITASGGNYGNTNVAAYLPTYNGNIGSITATNIRIGTGTLGLGLDAGLTNQGSNAVAIGNQAGNDTQSSLAVAIGSLAGQTTQGSEAVALGRWAGRTNQGAGAVALGRGAGSLNQGAYSVAVGYQAGFGTQVANSIIINATGSQLDANTSGFFVSPIASNTSAYTLYYNTTTKEITYGAATATYGNANVADYLPVYGGTVNSNRIINTGDVNLISESFVQVQYDPSGNYDPYTLGDGSWFYLGSPGVGGGLVFESNLTGTPHAIRLTDLGDITADGNITFGGNLINGASTWNFAANNVLTLPASMGYVGRDSYTNGMDLYNNNGGVGYVRMNFDDQSFVWVDPAGAHVQSTGGTWDFDTAGNLIAPGSINAQFASSPAAVINGFDINAFNVNANIGTFNTIYGTIGTASQTGITTVGTLTGLAVTGTTNTTTLQVSGNATIGNLLVTGNSTIIGNINMISGNSGQFFGNSPTGFNALYTGIAAGYTPLQHTIIQSSGNYNDYIQINLENVNSGNAATADYIVTADNGTDTTYYVDMGIASSNFDGLSPNIVGNSVRANDAYLYTLGNGAGNQGGNLIVGAGTEGKVVKIIAGGGHDHDVVATVAAGAFTVNGNITGTYIFGNGSQLTGLPATYSNTNVAAYLPIYTGNISAANISLTNNTSALTFNTGAYIYGDTVSRPGSITLQPNTSVAGFPSVVIGGAGRLAAPNGSVHAIFNTADLTVQVPLKVTSATAATSTSTGALTVSGGAGIAGNVYAGGAVVATGNITGNFFIGNGALLTGITASSNYGNTNVTSFLGSYGSNTIVTTGNITAGNLIGIHIGNASGTTATYTGNVTGNFFIGNGALLTGIVANTTYSNTNVASYLTGNIVVGNISGNEPNVTLVANTYSYVFSNVGNVSFPGNLTVTANTSVGNIFATGYYYANGAAFTGSGGSSNYGNTNVAAYLPTYSGNLGNITVTDIQTTATKIHLGSNAGITSQGSYSVAIGTQAGETSQSFKSVSIGYQAAQSSQLDSAVAIGNQAGQTSQSSGGIAIGWQAGQTSQSGGAVAIGTFAGLANQGSYSVALGMYAGSTNQANNSIILNASGTEVNAAASGFYVNPIRSNASLGNILYFDTTTNEITYGTSPAAGNYSNANVTSYLPTYTGNIAANIVKNNKTWTFESNGTLTVPGDSSIRGTPGPYSLSLAQNSGCVYVSSTNTDSSNYSQIALTYSSGITLSTTTGTQRNWSFAPTGNLTYPDGTKTSGNTVTLANSSSYYWKFNEPAGPVSDTITLSFNSLSTTLSNWYFGTDSTANTWILDSSIKSIGFSDSPGHSVGGRLTFGTLANLGTASANDIELSSVNANAYVRASNSIWKFDVHGALTVPSTITNGNGATISFNTNNARIDVGSGTTYVDIQDQDLFLISNTTVISSNGNTWDFVANGNLILPSNNSTIIYPNGASILSGITGGSSNYGNANVASFLGSYGSNTIVTTGNITAGYFVGNGALLTGITATANYNDSNVATLLASFGSNAISTTGNITAGNLNITGNIVDTGALSIITGSNGNISLTPNGTGIVSVTGALTATGNVTGNFFIGNGSLLTGIVASGSNYTNANVVSMLAANTALYLGNVVTAYPTASNITTVFIGNNTTITAGGSSNSASYMMNNLYFQANGQLMARNTYASGAGQFYIDGATFSWSAVNAATANTAAGLGSRMSLNSTALSTQNSVGITSAGTLTVQGASGLVTTQTTGALFNTTATTINLGGVATAINMGAATTVVTVGSLTGNLLVGNITTNSNITVNNTITTGNLTLAAAGVGNITGVGNLVGITSNTTITAGNYVTSFLSNGAVTTTSNVIVTGSNAISIPNLPAFRVYGNTSTQYTGGTTITNQVVDYNQGNYYNNATGIFTAPVPGIYHAVATLRVGSNNGLNQASLQKNSSGSGANVIAFWETDTNIGTATHFTMSGYAKLIAGDTIRLQVITGNVNLDSNDSWSVTFIG